MTAGRALTALGIDVILVLVFAAVGRGSHGEDVIGGLADTAWPFLLGLLVGWLAGVGVLRNRFEARRPAPAGVLIWACTLGVGMLARVLTGQGTAPTFILVAGVVLAAFLIGWRVVGLFVDRRWRGRRFGGSG